MKQRILIGVLLALWSALAPAAVIKTIQAGATDQTVVVKIIDSTDGTPEAAVAFNTAGIDLEYWRHGANSVVDITEVTQTVSGAHTDGGFVALGNGYYRLDLPDAAVASGVTAVEVMGTVTGMIVIGGTVDLSPPANTVAVGGTAQTGRDLGASVLISSGTGTGQLSVTSGVIAANATQIAGSAVSTSSAQIGVNVVNAGGTAWGSGAITAGSIATDAIGAAEVAADAGTELGTAAWATTTRQLTSSQTFSLTGNITGNLSGSAGSVTGAVGSVTGNVGGNVTGSVGSVTAVSSGAITEASFATTAGSFRPLGIIDQGTAQAYTAGTPSLTLRSAAAFGDDTLEGVTALICGSTQGYCQATTIASNVGSTDVATLSAALPVAAAGTITYYLFGTAAASGGGGGGGDATEAKQDTILANLAIVDGIVDSILVDTGTTLDDLVDDLESRLGTPSNLGSGATVAANLADIEGQTDDIGVAGAGLTAADDAVMTRLGTPAGASVSADVAAVKSDTAAILVDTSTTLDDMVDDLETRLTATRAGYLDNLSAGAVATAAALTTVDGVVDTIQVTTDKLDDTLELDSTVYRFTANSLEQAPTGSGESLSAIADAVWDELLSGHAVSGSTGEALSTAAAGGGGGLDAAGVRAAIGLATANLDTQLGDIPTVSEFNARTVTSATYATATSLQTVDDNVDAVLADTAEIGVAGAGLTAVDDAVLSAIAALNNLSATQVRDLIIEDQGGGVSLGCALSVILAYAGGDVATTGSSSTYRDPSGTETRGAGTVTSNGNRNNTITCPTY